MGSEDEEEPQMDTLRRNQKLALKIMGQDETLLQSVSPDSSPLQKSRAPPKSKTGSSPLAPPRDGVKRAAKASPLSSFDQTSGHKGEHGHQHKPGMRFQVIKRKAAVTDRTWAWWDSVDGINGGSTLRFGSQPADTDAIRAFDLFPGGPHECTVVLTDGKTSVDFTYASIAPCNADKDGPAGFIMIAPAEVKWPIDADLILPAFEKQVERMRRETSFVEERAESFLQAQSIAEAEARAQQRAAEAEKSQHEAKLKQMQASARRAAPTSWLGKEPPTEYAVWTQIRPGGIPPPPQKHPLVNVHTYEKHIQVGGPRHQPGENDLPEEERAMLENQRIYEHAHIRTLEVWNHQFTLRYNLNLKISDISSGANIVPETIDEQLHVWTQTRVFKTPSSSTPHGRPSAVNHHGKKPPVPEESDFHPSVRDAPACTYHPDGKLYLFGGKTKGGQYKNYLSDLWIFDYATNTWTNVPKKDGSEKEEGGESAQAKVRALTSIDRSGDGDAPEKRAPTHMTGKIPGPRSSALTMIKDGFYWVAGGQSSAGKLKDVKRLDLETLVWYDMIPEGTTKRNQIVNLEVETIGEPPKRGFCMKNLALPSSLYAAFVSEETVQELCLNSLKWRSLQTEGLLCWDTSKIMAAEDGPMLRVSSVDFSSAQPTDGRGHYPAVETASVWRVYDDCQDNEARDDAPKAWQILTGQTLKFNNIPCLGDPPGIWTVHGISKGVLHRERGGGRGVPLGRTRTSYYVFGGCRQGGIAQKSHTVDVRREQVVGVQVNPRIGLPVVLRKGCESVHSSQAPSTAGSGGHKTASDDISSNFRPGTESTRHGTSWGGGGRMGSSRIGTGFSKRSNFVMRSDGQLKTGVITWIEQGNSDPTLKNMLVRVLWDDDVEEADFIQRRSISHMDEEQTEEEVEEAARRKAVHQRKYSAGANGKYDLALHVDHDAFDVVADHITNDIFELDIVEASSQAKLVKDLEDWKDRNGDLDVAALRMIVKDKLIMKKTPSRASASNANPFANLTDRTPKRSNIPQGQEAQMFLTMASGVQDEESKDSLASYGGIAEADQTPAQD